MTSQIKTRHCTGILFHGFDVNLQFYNCQVSTYFCVFKCLFLQFFCLKGDLLCMMQFHSSHLNIKGSAYCLAMKNAIANCQLGNYSLTSNPRNKIPLRCLVSNCSD